MSVVYPLNRDRGDGPTSVRYQEEHQALPGQGKLGHLVSRPESGHSAPAQHVFSRPRLHQSLMAEARAILIIVFVIFGT